MIARQMSFWRLVNGATKHDCAGRSAPEEADGCSICQESGRKTCGLPGTICRRGLFGRKMTANKITAALRLTLCFGVAAVWIASASQARAQIAVATPVPETFTNPVYVTGAPRTADLLFVVEKAGVIQVLQNEAKQPTPFLDIQARVSTNGERGLLSVAFPRNYALTRRFYVAYTNLNGDIEIDEFQRHPTNPLRAAPGSRRALLIIRHREAANHNGGQLQFGPDGLLYISTGDGGAVGTLGGKYARDLRSLLGKILRIDPTPDGAMPYTIPPDNPFVGLPRRRAEIFAYGLRNPWRFSFDGGNIVIGDVGQASEEEVNFLTLDSARGANFGWPAFEGNSPFDKDQPAAPDPVFPMHTYSHDGGGCAVISGYVSRDRRIPALSGRYVYGDFCTGQISAFVPHVPSQEARRDRPILQGSWLTSFGLGPGGRMYFTQDTGELMRIDPVPP
jgi:glucose/arabinose dehydrogenase